jgi:thioredoxin reductase/Pyruvate/2-oxoacid:ferredoxin oxidoreductase delta subunit
MADVALYMYLTPMLLIWGIYCGLRTRKQRRSARVRNEAQEAGLVQPASLHPVINSSSCLGCRSCVSACPEKGVLGVINNKSELISPTNCIGHGACKTACPFNAITLVFGTSERGVDIPLVAPNFETNVPGLFIAGELGGMGLIRNAIEQGRQAMESITEHCRKKNGQELDVVIIGAGPAGLSASLAAQENKLRFVTLEQDTFGGTVSHFPRGKIVMTAPVKLPLVGNVKFREISKEALLDFWEDVIRKTGVQISYRERVEAITTTDSGLEVRTPGNVYQTKSVLLAIGRRGTPRKLGVAGEDSTKVVYRLIDPEQYRGQKVLVVGGGDSALEAAVSIAELPDTVVSLAYRSAAFSRAKEKNRRKVEDLENSGSLNVFMNTNVKEIYDTRIEIDQQGSVIDFDNDAVIVCAGGILPTPFLKEIGIQVETKYGTQ